MKLAILFLLTLMTIGEASPAPLKLRFPISNRDRIKMANFPIFGFDHDDKHGSDKSECLSSQGMRAPYCYNDHEGTDFMLVGGFWAMDHGSAQVVAAAAGEVIEAEDGNFDRCMVDMKAEKGVSCSGRELLPNFVRIRHADGSITEYYHLKKWSILVGGGQYVECGQVLGLIGSSGISTGPHLHFGVINPDGKYVDPYKGKYSQKFSYWKQEYMVDGLPSASCDDDFTAANACSIQIIQDAVTCGTEFVQDANRCGTQLVNCGKEMVNCGTSMVTSAAICGENIINNIYECAKNGFGLIRGCRVPKTCSVTQQCEVDKKCNIAKSCYVAKSCQVCR